MANKRTLKHVIRQISSQLFAECVAASLYGTRRDEASMEALLKSIIKLESHYIHRVSHPQPGMTAKAYYQDLTSKFKKDVDEIIDHINSPH